MSTRAIAIIAFCILQISASQGTKKISNKPSDVLKSADVFLIAEHCSPPNHMCPAACPSAEDIEIICVTNGQLMMKIQNRCEYERIRSCCPIYKNTNWKMINCNLVNPVPPTFSVESFCQSTCQKGQPVCTTDGSSFITFPSECEFQKAKQCAKNYNGFQPFGQYDCKWIKGSPQEVCSDPCVDVTNTPVCATNGFGIGYFVSQCELLKAIKCCPNYEGYIATDTARCVKSEINEMEAVECIAKELRIDQDYF